jgi:ATP-dependent DNA helicase RecQ
LVVLRFDHHAELADYLSAYEQRHMTDRRRIESMMRYGTTTECRWRYLTAYLEEPSMEDCERCDNCAARRAGTLTAPIAPAALCAV